MAVSGLAACSTPAAPTPSPIAAASAPATRVAEVDCPAVGTAPLPDLAEGMVPADAVSAYLDSGGAPTALAAALFDRSWETPTSTVVWTDVDGDGELDFAAGLVGAPDAEGFDHEGSVHLWRCHDGAYLRTEIAPARPGFGPPAIRQARDLTADGVPEVLVAYPRCGAHTCFAQFAVLQWDGSGMVDRFQGASDDMPSPELAVHAESPGSPAAIEVTATGIGSVGAGPYRIWSRTWSWEGDARAFAPGEPAIEAPRFRIHAIHDADDAYRRGDLATALALYQRAIDEDGLLDWPSAGDGREELAAYAAFRRVLTFLTADEAVNAQAELDRWPVEAGASTGAYAELARRLIAAYAASGLEDACAAASAFASDNLEGVVAPLDFGYANRTYTAEDLCPLAGIH